MARAYVRERIVSNVTGLPLANAVVTVREVGTTTALAATMYAALTGGTTVSNPITTGADGVVSFYLDTPQDVDFRVVAAGYPDATIGSIKGHADQGDIVSKTGTQTLTNKTLTSPVLNSPEINNPTLNLSGPLALPSSGLAWAYAGDLNTGARWVGADEHAMVAGGSDIVHMRKGTKLPQVGMGSLNGAWAWTGGQNNILHVHHATSVATDGDIVAGYFELTNNANSGGAGTIPDSGAVTGVFYQDAATADGAGRGGEFHAIRGHASAGASANSSLMGIEVGVHSLAAGNASFPNGSGAAPKNIGIFLNNSDAAGFTNMLRADVGLFIKGQRGFKSGIHWVDTDGTTVLFDVSQNGSMRTGKGGNAASPQWTFFDDPDTGVFWVGTNTLGISTGGGERVRIDSNGVGIGVAPVSAHRLSTSGGDIQFLSGAAGTNLLFEFGRTAVDATLAIAGAAGQYAANAAQGDAVLRSESQKLLLVAGGGNSSVTIGVSGGQPTLGLFGVTATTRPTAFTQTYATATKTHSNLTSSTLTVSVGTGSTTIADVGAAFNQTTLNNIVRSLADQINAQRVDLVNVKGVLNAVIDDGQLVGNLQ